MRILLYIVILAAMLFAPVHRLDVSKLEPVQTVAVRISDEEIVIETDTKNKGQGETLASAIADLEKNTPGVIYLDTAQYLMLTTEATQYASELEKYLRRSIKVSLWDGEGSVERAAKFLAIRQDLPALRQWNATNRQVAEKSSKK